MPNSIEREFNTAMLEIYKIAKKETSQTHSRFFNMVNDQGGLDSARVLLHANGVSDGFIELALKGRLDLTVEALVLSRRWRSLFTPDELARAETRLRQHGFDVTTLLASDPENETGFPNLRQLVSELNDLSERYEIGNLREIRKELHPASRGGRYRIFDEAADTVAGGEYTFHHGGRRELQFNVGFETVGEERAFRYGVAFSMEKSKWVQDVMEVLTPKIARFNEFLRLNPSALQDFEMWAWKNHTYLGSSPVRAISEHEIDGEVFIMVGRRQASPPIYMEEVLRDFDRLLPLYRFVESSESDVLKTGGEAVGLRFVPGHHAAKTITRATQSPSAQIDVQLRHNGLQTKIYDYLVMLHGRGVVGTEQYSGHENRVDIVVKLDTGFVFYELKPSVSARACIREGLSQILEYSYWPNSTEAERLILVGEYPPTADEKLYIERLRTRFSLPIWYQWFDEASGTLRE